ncbi:MAG: nucleoside deaminase [Desulfovibrio sp.]|jgi:tRNA(Arg) A34 adenosine deaminase TadA|nr:nucleoside deaminase [Desulfovibrio sp.]
MREAIRMAYLGIDAGHGGPFGAVAADMEGNILSVAHNEVLKSGDPTSHAEILAIRALGGFSLPRVVLYATGYPCPMCLSALLWARVSIVYYCNDYVMAKSIGFDDDAFMRVLGEIYCCNPRFSPESHTGRLSIRHLPLPEGKALYDYWMSRPDRGRY